MVEPFIHIIVGDNVTDNILQVFIHHLSLGKGNLLLKLLYITTLDSLVGKAFQARHLLQIYIQKDNLAQHLCRTDTDVVLINP